MKKLIPLFLFALLLTACSGQPKIDASQIDSFDQCVAAGFQTEDMKPNRCKVGGKIFNRPQQITL